VFLVDVPAELRCELHDLSRQLILTVPPLMRFTPCE
jgi:hypothetical protein